MIIDAGCSPGSPKYRCPLQATSLDLLVDLSGQCSAVKTRDCCAPSAWGDVIATDGHFSSCGSRLAGRNESSILLSRLDLMQRYGPTRKRYFRQAVKGGGSARAINSFDMLEQRATSASTKYKILIHQDIRLAIRIFFHW